MTKHEKMQSRLKASINNAILDCGEIDGTKDTALTNTDVVEALLELTGLYASVHGFESCSRTDLAFKHALTIMAHIERYQELRRKRKLPFNVIPRAKIN
ncbi:hypothetical protein J3R80_05445 [Aliiroseovarius sp. Z3]|uniref:hypothetical protein n=1 Tax=Aliiroseovarius sp. Z3 TaxID=2811402 RepID=UPI0023B32983|nr:hypothetical protein [Aliiroseovarius sp. Z3]MDE9449914.1 hypothetical protein [Aliiroseovarius sp. Z3]